MNVIFPPRNSDIILLMETMEERTGRSCSDISWASWANGNTDRSAAILAVTMKTLGANGDGCSFKPGGGDVVVKF